MRFSNFLALASALPFTLACYRVHGQIAQHTNTATQSTTYLPSIFLELGTERVCDGHSGFGSGEESNPFQPDFIPGGVPTNSSFSGPWSGANCTKPYTNVEVNGINGQVLVRDYETAFWIQPEQLNWQQPASHQGLAGIPNTFASYWTFDSGDVHC
ncbi:hypothetical protein GLAREA_09455 [Glarea lozoyensis ATCC 20868]|uniref:Uncharacterized protein n=1 Tax=Glarea lozoyensis (strain ATCC 20868 / MF5171) TaxID=1116229 RepID=S3CRQ4_GLAL2|nr:uncharacterized protein GLAREA_09455 [Glarea lozoyensis ATCC 20868]EPE28335.1 hypothetical protein GLAREA_09455 [Glarea lozoyensis ATCC 20868]